MYDVRRTRKRVYLHTLMHTVSTLALTKAIIGSQLYTRNDIFSEYQKSTICSASKSIPSKIVALGILIVIF